MARYLVQIYNFLVKKIPLTGRDVLLNSRLLCYYDLKLKQTVIEKCESRFREILQLSWFDRDES
jgi:hypothetical protein